MKKNKISFILILGLLTAFGPLSMDMYLPGLPNIAEEYNTSISLTQASITATLIGLALGQLFFGPLSDIIGRKRPLLTTLTIYTIVSLLIIFTSDIWIFILLRFIQGFSAAAGIVISRAMSRDVYSGKALTEFMSTLAIVNGAAPIIAPLLGGIIISFSSWKLVFITLFIIGLIMLISIIFLLPETLPQYNRQNSGLLDTFKNFKYLLKDTIFIKVALTQGFISASMFAYISGSSFILQNIYGFTPVQFSMMFAINGLGIIVLAKLTGFLSRKLSELLLLRVGTIISLTGSLILFINVFYLPQVWLILIAFFLIVSSVGMVNTTSFSIGMQRYDKLAGSASAFLGILPFALGGIVSPLVGMAGEFTAIPLAVVILLTSLLASILANSMHFKSKSNK